VHVTDCEKLEIDTLATPAFVEAAARFVPVVAYQAALVSGPALLASAAFYEGAGLGVVAERSYERASLVPAVKTDAAAIRSLVIARGQPAGSGESEERREGFRGRGQRGTRGAPGGRAGRAACFLPSTSLYLRKPSDRPPSTGITWPVVLRRRGETSRRIASAWSSGSIGDRVSERSA
jgi:hypothetical protein